MKNNPFLPYLNNNKIKFSGLSLINSYKIIGKISAYDNIGAYIIHDTDKRSYYCNWNDMKIHLYSLDNIPNKLYGKIDDLGFNLSYPKQYIRDGDGESRDFNVLEVSKLTQLLINEGVDIGIVPKKYLNFIKIEEKCFI